VVNAKKWKHTQKVYAVKIRMRLQRNYLKVLILIVYGKLTTLQENFESASVIIKESKPNKEDKID
jgi:hypothetical protein